MTKIPAMNHAARRTQGGRSPLGEKPLERLGEKYAPLKFKAGELTLVMNAKASFLELYDHPWEG